MKQEKKFLTVLLLFSHGIFNLIKNPGHVSKQFISQEIFDVLSHFLFRHLLSWNGDPDSTIIALDSAMSVVMN